MNTLYVMIGLPASGKSYHAKKLAKEKRASIVSTDEIRYELFGDATRQKKTNHVFYELYTRMEELLSKNKDVIVDATNLEREKRINLLSKFPDTLKVAYYVDTPFDICVKRNKNRKRTLPYWVLEKLYKKLEIPFLSEGFDDVKTIHEPFDYRITKQEFIFLLQNEVSYETLFSTLNSISFFNKMKGFNQENPHHSHALCWHTYHVLEYINAFYDEEDKLLIQIASLFHDVGKPFCKKFKPLKGHFSYYAHERVSSQIAFHFLTALGFEENFISKVIGLIEMHMKIAYGGDSGATEIYHLLGGELLTKLYIFNEADRYGK